MTNNHQDNHQEPLAEMSAEVRENRRISPFWLLPFIALCIGAILFFRIVQEQGVMVKITFDNADGLIAGKTQIRYQGLQIGIVKKVHFTDDLQHVEVIANINSEAKSVLRENTKFWVVKPTASLAGISGIDALVSGNYIALRPGDGDHEDEFIAENDGPVTQVNEGDLLVHLLADDLGSISVGALVYYKKMPVGKIYDYRFTADHKKVEIDVVIDKPYANLVKKDSHFWNISGVSSNISLSGIKINMDSLSAIVQGAVAFDSPSDSPVAKANQQYTLYSNLKAAQRGIPIEIIVPKVTGLQAGQTTVYAQDMQIGVLSELSAVENNDEILMGKLLVDHDAENLFKAGSQIILRNKKLSLGDLTDMKKVLRGEYFEVIAGNGENRKLFKVIKENEWLLKQPNTLVFNLIAPETYGISEGQHIYYNHINIGEIIKQEVSSQSVVFKVAVIAEHRHLIRPDALFVAASNLDINLGIDGIKIEAANPEKWLQGGVRLIRTGKQEGKPLASYPLYSSVSNAELGIIDNNPQPTLTLTTKQLSGISKGSLVLHRQYEVGRVLDIRPTEQQFEVDLFIYPKHQNLLTTKSRFWIESAAQIDVTVRGVSIQANPVMRTLKGAISFDNIGSENNRTLYPSELRAKSAGHLLTFIAEDASYLSKGMNLRYMGLNVGEIEQIQLSKENKIIVTALISGNYMDMIAKEGSKFKIISPKIAASGIENIDSLLQPYIDIEIGNGKRKTKFLLSQSNPIKPKYSHGLPIILETTDATNIMQESPVMYRGVEVGIVHRLELNGNGDRVLVHLLIGEKHQHLVRQNSQFWISSGYGMDIGLTGVSINTGSMNQLLKGGISFSTPSSTVIQPAAKANQRFLLQIKRPKEAPTWNSAVAEQTGQQ